MGVGAYLGHALEMPGLLDDPAGETQGELTAGSQGQLGQRA